MDYIKTKVYFDGSHYVGIPKVAQYWKKRKHKSKPRTNETETKVKQMLSERTNETKQEKTKRVINELNSEINWFLRVGEDALNVGDKVMTICNRENYCNGELDVEKHTPEKSLESTESINKYLQIYSN